MKIEQVKIQDLKPADYNPRKWDEKMIADLKASIQKFGIVDPIIVNGAQNRHNIVIGGHFRLFVAKQLGFTEIPVIYVNLEDEAQERELNLRLNKNLGEWDWKALAEFDQDLISAVGFSKEQLGKIFDLKANEDGLEITPVAEPKTKPGDLFQLGEHRLLCGDATKKEDYEKLCGDLRADLIFTDPPYNVDYKSPGGLDYASTKFGGTGGKIFNDDKTDEEALEFYTQTLQRLAEFSKDHATIYWWFANANNWINRQAFFNAKWHMSQIIVWVKNSMVFSQGQDYHRLYEPCMVGWKEKKSHYTNKTLSDLKDVFNLDHDDFLELPDVWFEHRDVTTEYIHPTQKPIRLAERALKKNSFEGAVVMDVFGGSGSTLIACEQMKRKCLTMELDPKYCDAIIDRWEKQSGQKAIKL
jgi:DNA modification methylase